MKREKTCYWVSANLHFFGTNFHALPHPLTPVRDNKRTETLDKGWCYFHSLECHSPGSEGVKIIWKGLGNIIFTTQGGEAPGSENNVTQALPCYFHSPIFLKENEIVHSGTIKNS